MIYPSKLLLIARKTQYSLFVIVVLLQQTLGFFHTATSRHVTIRRQTNLKYGYRPDGSCPSFDGKELDNNPLDTPTRLNVASGYSSSIHGNEKDSIDSRKKVKEPLRRWNLNRGGSPFGFGLNAEVWNGRVAQVRFESCSSYRWSSCLLQKTIIVKRSI
jgi:hypothetical protein